MEKEYLSYFETSDCPAYRKDLKQKSFAIKSGLLVWLSLAIFIAVCLVGVVSAVGTYPAVDPNMVLYYHFNNNSAIGEDATHITDSSTFSNNGTNNTASLPIFISNGGYLQDGAFNYNGVNTEWKMNQKLFNLTQIGAITVSTWIYRDSISSDDGDIVAYYAPSNGQRNFIFRLNNNATSMSIKNLELGDCSSTGATQVPFKTWTHVAGRWNGTDVTVFINGIEDDSTPAHCENSSYSDVPTLFIGTGRQSFDWNGSIDETIIWNRSLSNVEIWNLYNQYVGCFEPTENLKIGGIATLCTNNYYSNDTDENGFINIVSDNVILDMNGSTLVGNSTGTNIPRSSAFWINNGINNFTLKNGNIINYRNGLRIATSNRINITNMNISGGRYAFIITTGSSNIFIENSRFSDTIGSLYFDQSTNISIYNNWMKSTSIEFSPSLPATTHITIINNNFTQDPPSLSYHIRNYNVSSINISGNSFYNISTIGHGNIYSDQAEDMNIFNNTFDYNDRALHFNDMGKNIRIFLNSFTNSYTHTDAYDAPIVMQGNRGISSHIQNWTNLKIYNNSFTDFGCNGIVLRAVYDLEIYNNIFSQNLTKLLSLPYNCKNEPMTAIFIHQAYKGFIPSGSQSTDNYTVASNFSSSNINVHNNSFNNLNVYLRTQGATNITFNEEENFWFRSFQNYYSFDKEDWWINNDWNNLSVFFNATASGDGGVFIDTFWSTAAGARPVFNITIYKDYELIKNIYVTTPLDMIYGRFNNTNALIFNTNGSIYGNSDISLNDGNINITLPPGNSTCIFDNANLTEGISRGSGSCVFPLTITQVDGLTYNSESTLSSSVISSVYIDVGEDGIDCDNILSVSGLTSYSCSDATGILSGSQTIANGDNYIYITYSQIGSGICSSILNIHTLTSGQLGLIFLVVMFGVILSLVFGIIHFQSERANPWTAAAIFIVVMVCAILLSFSALITTALCTLGS